jgi:hypothetical protein
VVPCVGVKGNVNFTLDGLRIAELQGITASEVWQVLNAERRVVRAVGERSRVIVAATAVGRYLAVMVQEDPIDDEDDTWDVVAARAARRGRARLRTATEEATVIKPINDPLDGVDVGALLEHGQEATLPAPTDSQPMVKTSIKLPVELYDWLRTEAQDVGVSTLLRRYAEEKRIKAAAGGHVLVALDDVERVISDLIRRSRPPAA